jgi:hypothetical protein
VNRGEMDRARRRALNILDEWLDVTGLLAGSSYRDELEGVIEHAVECGAQAALGVREPLESEKP